MPPVRKRHPSPMSAEPRNRLFLSKYSHPLVRTKKIAQAEQERKDKSASDWWLVKLTAILAGIGVIQVVVFSIQAYRLAQSVDEMKIAIKATDKVAEAAIVSSMPVLSPWIVGGNLHPFKTDGEVLYPYDEPKNIYVQCLFRF